MRFHEIINEAKLTFTSADFQKAADESEYHVVHITMTGDGALHIGERWHARGDKNDPEYHPDAGWRRSLKITLWAKTKTIDIRSGSVGENLKPKVQQAIRSLRDAGIVDNTWTIKTARQAAYYNDEGKYTYLPNTVDEKGIDALTDKMLRLSPVTKDMILYHGTSTMDWTKIQKVGLHPLGYGTNTQYGSESRFKHEGNTKVLYLAGTPDKAMNYAKTRVTDWNIKLRKSEYITAQDGSNDPVILQVQVPDVGRLVADDDIVNELARKIARKLWAAKTPEDQQAIMAELSKQRGFEVKDPSVGMMLWRETDEGFAEIFAKVPPRIFKAWKASLNRENQVGYRGIIPPKFIKRIL